MNSNLNETARAIVAGLATHGFREAVITKHLPGLGLTVGPGAAWPVSVTLKPVIGGTALAFECPGWTWDMHGVPRADLAASAVAGLVLLARMPLVPRADGMLELSPD